MVALALYIARGYTYHSGGKKLSNRVDYLHFRCLKSWYSDIALIIWIHLSLGYYFSSDFVAIYCWSLLRRLFSSIILSLDL